MTFERMVDGDIGIAAVIIKKELLQIKAKYCKTESDISEKFY